MRLTSSDAIMAYAFIRVKDAMEKMIAGMEVTKWIAQVRYYIISKRTTPTFNIFGCDFGVNRIYFQLYLTQASTCPWSTPTSHDNVLQCNDGTYCNGLNDGWDCCNIHGMRKQCPKNYPAMCAKTNCAWGDYCCYTEDHCVAKLGGLRSCNATGIM